jgi:uncharacterized protein YcfJ
MNIDPNIKRGAFSLGLKLKDTLSDTQGVMTTLKGMAHKVLDQLEKLPTKSSDQEIVDLVELYCQKCGNKFTHVVRHIGRNTGTMGGAAAGAAAGAKVGIAAGPLGAMAATIPGAILGAIAGNAQGNKSDQPVCKQCGTSFAIPK